MSSRFGFEPSEVAAGQSSELEASDLARWREKTFRAHEVRRLRNISIYSVAVEAVLGDLADAAGMELLEIEPGEWSLGDKTIGADVIIGARSVSVISHTGIDAHLGLRNRDRLLAALHQETGLPISFSWTRCQPNVAGARRGGDSSIIFPPQTEEQDAEA